MSGANGAAPRPLTSGLLLAAIGAIAFSGKAIIVKVGYRHGVDAVTMLMLRMLFALPLFMLLSWWAGRGKPPLTRRDGITVVGLGFSGYYLSSYLDFLGLQYISAGLERLILYLGPTLVLLISLFVYKKPVKLSQVLALVVSYCGVLLVFGHEVSLAGVDRSDTWRGAALVLASASVYAVYLSASGQEVQRLGATRLTGLATTVACVLCIAQFVVLRPLAAANVGPTMLWLSLLNALVCTVAPVLMVMMAIERIGATMTAQTGMIGPLSTIAMGVLILDEAMNAWIAAGTLLVLAGVWLLARSR